VRRRVLSLCFLLIVYRSPAAADELRLTNGDRLTGQVDSLAGGTLTFTTAYGNVGVPWADVIALTVDQPVLVTIGTNPPVQGTIAAAGDGQARLEPGGTMPLAQITALSRPQPAVLMDGGANAGYNTTSGNTDVNSLRLDGDVVVRAAANRYTANAGLIRAKDSGIETARTWTAALKYDRFVTPRLFLNASTNLTNDPFRDLDLRTALGAGVGYQVLDNGRVILRANAGLGYVKENFASQGDDSYAAAHESASLSASLIPGQVEFFHLHDAYVGVTGNDNVFVKMQNGVRLTLIGGFVMTLRHDLDYDLSPAIARDQADRAVALTLGYRF
jgi:putative salt-induced outer membrane protein YdiY